MLSRDEIYSELQRLTRACAVNLFFYPLHYRAGEFLFPKLVSQNISPRDKILLIAAGVHANEIAGPLTIVRYGREMVEYALARGVKLIIYPLRNPSAYGIPGKRYHIDANDDTVEHGNNDFLRYELADGNIIGDLKDGKDFRLWGWSSDARFAVALPPETRRMHELLRQDPLDQVRALIDLHQDYLTRDAPALVAHQLDTVKSIRALARNNQVAALAYHYAYGDLSRYTRIVDEIARAVPIARNRLIGAGYRGADGSRDSASEAMQSDANGFIVRHDGTLPDLLYRIGEAQGRDIHAITPETTGATPLEIACEVNWIWIRGVIELICQMNSCR